jgi:acetyltransferase EpsM
MGLIGAGRLAREFVDLAIQSGYNVIEMYDELTNGTEPHTGIKIVNKINPDLYYMFAIGEPLDKRLIYNRLEVLDITFQNCLSHPSCVIGSRVKIGEGTALQARVVITCDTNIGKHVVINLGAYIAHDVDVGDFSIISPQADLLGRVKIGEGVYIGAGAQILPDIKIGDWAIIGAGAIVTKDVPAFEVWCGNPA